MLSENRKGGLFLDNFIMETVTLFPSIHHHYQVGLIVEASVLETTGFWLPRHMGH